jgi:hypothetical protein
MRTSLIDPQDGENLAVRCFLMLYTGGATMVRDIREGMRTAGFPHWPEWVEADDAGSLSKLGAQNWLRHLFALENPPASKVAHACHIDLEVGQSPDECVLDIGRVDDCVYARRYGEEGRKRCGQWKPITIQPASNRRSISDTATLSERVLQELADLKDDAAVHIHPRDLEKCASSECVVQVYSVRVGGPNGEHTVPLFSTEQVAQAIANATKESA